MVCTTSAVSGLEAGRHQMGYITLAFSGSPEQGGTKWAA